MKVLYLSQRFNFKTSGIYADLINKLVVNGHDVVIVTCDTKDNIKEPLSFENGCTVLRVPVPNQFGGNFIKKGLVQLLIEPKMISGIKKYLSDKSFDLVLYPTPPITFANVVAFCKRKYGCKSYLMLKDIFPQNAIDLGLMKKSGIIYKYFKIIEKKLYKNSDYIGCMSEANMKYIKKHQPWIDHNKIELFPNTVDSSKFKRGKTVGLSKTELGVPENTTLFLFGGNLSKPQGIDFLLGCLYELREYSEAYFLIIGSGTEFEKIHSFITENNLKNVKLLKEVERDRYEMIVNICDVGLILLDYRFTIPNYPARTLSYMIQSLPLLAATDVNTDIKELIEEQAKCGYWCASNNVTDFVTMVKLLCLDAEKRVTMGLNGRKYFEEHFDVSVSVSILEKHFQVR